MRPVDQGSASRIPADQERSESSLGKQGMQRMPQRDPGAGGPPDPTGFVWRRDTTWRTGAATRSSPSAFSTSDEQSPTVIEPARQLLLEKNMQPASSGSHSGPPLPLRSAWPATLDIGPNQRTDQDASWSRRSRPGTCGGSGLNEQPETAVLACGRGWGDVLDQVANGCLRLDGHQARCGHCQGALVDLIGAWQPLHDLAATPVHAPHDLMERVMARVRAGARDS